MTDQPEEPEGKPEAKASGSGAPPSRVPLQLQGHEFTSENQPAERPQRKQNALTSYLHDYLNSASLRSDGKPRVSVCNKYNPAVRKVVAAGVPQHVAWASETTGRGRGFGFTGGHFHWNWGGDDFRKTGLNGIVWVAGLEVPKEGVPSKTPTVEELQANQDYNAPKNFNRESMQKKIDAWNTK